MYVECVCVYVVRVFVQLCMRTFVYVLVFACVECLYVECVHACVCVCVCVCICVVCVCVCARVFIGTERICRRSQALILRDV